MSASRFCVVVVEKREKGANVQEKTARDTPKTAWPQTIISRLSRFYADGVRRHDDDGDDNNGYTLEIPVTGRKEGFNLLVGAWVKVGTNGRTNGGIWPLWSYVLVLLECDTLFYFYCHEL